MRNLQRLFKPVRIRNIFCSLFFGAAGIAALSAISSSRAMAQRDATRRSTPSCPPPCSMPVGLSESFDNVSPPALPPDWLATNALGPPPLWVTSNAGVPLPPADTWPNAASIDDPAVVSDKRLDSLAFPIPPAHPLQLAFRQNFNLEASDVDPNLGFDGGVLEVSFDGGNTFQDILDAGGSFVQGGYNRTISTDRGSPIAGRQAWSGNSEGFITTVVNLPILSTGTRLRWRMASDTSGSGEGWRVDTINIAGCAPVPCQTPTARPRITPFPRPTRPPRNLLALPSADFDGVKPTPSPRPTPFPRPVPISTTTPHATPVLTPLPRPSPP
jgi:hypothetical protein